MSRTTAEVLTAAESFLPRCTRPARPLLAGWAAATSEAEAAVDAAAAVLHVGDAEGMWLDLLARGDGLRRAGGEADAVFRRRIRRPATGVTRPDLLDAVNEILTDYGATTDAVMYEWWEDGFADVSHADHSLLIDPGACFVLVVPLIGDPEAGGSFADASYADGAGYGGATGSWAPYAAIVAAVNAMKAAGVRWRLFVNTDGDLYG